jgi:hypothetical protein
MCCASFSIVACGKKQQAANGAASSATPSATASAAPPQGPVPVGIPIAAEKVAKVVNPKGEQPYAGPTGRLTGVVTIEGDPPPELGYKVPRKCGEAAATYGKLFRVGQDKTLADVLVTVTRYKGFVPAKGEAAKITMRGCAFARRTVAATFGQRIEVANLDPSESHMPFLLGAPSRAVMVAVPKGAPVKTYPVEPGHYLLRDQLPNPFLHADVYVLKFATFDVTGLDGGYEIDRIPVGKVRVDALLPVLGKNATREIEIKPGDNKLDLTITFDAAADRPKWPLGSTQELAAAAPASASPSASPGASARPPPKAPKR